VQRRAVASWVITYVVGNIDSLLKGFEDFRLSVTARAASDLRAIREEFAKAGTGEMLSISQAGRLAQILRELRPTFRAETLGKFTFVVAENRLDTEKLSTNIAALFRRIRS
jgi:hypothetical protein